jgi:hypothetical protein
MSTSDDMKATHSLLQKSPLPRDTTLSVLVLLGLNVVLATWGFIQVMP